MVRDPSFTPIAESGTHTAYLICAPVHRKALSSCISLCEAMLTSNITQLEKIAKEKQVEINLPLWRNFFDIAYADTEQALRLMLLNNLHAVFEFEKPEFVALSRGVSLTLIQGMELSLAFGMQQWSKLPSLFGELGLTLNDKQREALSHLVSNHKAFAPALGLSPKVNTCFLLCYEISKVLKRFWSHEHTNISVWRDGLTVRYSQEVAPYCLTHAPSVDLADTSLLNTALQI